MTASDPTPAQEIPAPAQKSRAGRDLPAAIGVGVGLIGAVVVTLTWWHWGFILMMALMFSLGAVEVYGALRRIGLNAAIVPIVAGTIAMQVGTYAAATLAGTTGIPWHSTLLGFLGATVLAAMIWRMPKGAKGYVADTSASLFIISYIGLLGSFASLILAGEHGAARLVAFMLCIVGSDTGGYVAGVLFGRHPMAPTISPKKTWEGFVGSLIFAIAAGVAMMVFVLHAAWWIGVILGVVLVFFGTCGDLIESMIKRDVGIKDMSSILPGHGGVMDRLDSMLVGAPAAWIVLYLLIPGG